MTQPEPRIFIHEDAWGMRNLYPLSALEEAKADMDASIAAAKRNSTGEGTWSDMHIIKRPSADFTGAGLTLAAAEAALTPLMPRVRVFDAALPQAPDDPYGSHENDAWCYALDETCFVKLEPKGDLVAGIWFEAPEGDPEKLKTLRAAITALDALAPSLIADYWLHAFGQVANDRFLTAYFSALTNSAP